MVFSRYWELHFITPVYSVNIGVCRTQHLSLPTRQYLMNNYHTHLTISPPPPGDKHRLLIKPAHPHSSLPWLCNWYRHFRFPWGLGECCFDCLHDVSPSPAGGKGQTITLPLLTYTNHRWQQRQVEWTRIYHTCLLILIRLSIALADVGCKKERCMNLSSSLAVGWPTWLHGSEEWWEATGFGIVHFVWMSAWAVEIAGRRSDSVLCGWNYEKSHILHGFWQFYFTLSAEFLFNYSRSWQRRIFMAASHTEFIAPLL